MSEYIGVFTGLWQNSLLSLHPLATETVSSQQESDRWFEQLLGVRQKFYVDLERYVNVYNNLDTDKMREVVETHRFYDPTNSLIQLTESLRRGEPDSINLNTAIEAANTQSHYARALRRGWKLWAGASRLHAGHNLGWTVPRRFN